MRLSSLENSVTLKSSASPTSTTEPSSFSRFLIVAKPSKPYGSSNTAPLSFLETTVHLCTEPTGKTLSKVSHGFSSNCLCPNANLLLSTSSYSTTTSNSSPTLTYSDGCLIFLVQERSDTNKSIDTFFQLKEQAEVSQVSYHTFMLSTYSIFGSHVFFSPWILSKLLDT